MANQQAGILGSVTYCCRHAMSMLFHSAPPDMVPEVRNLLAELHFSNRDLNRLYKIFQDCREHDPITVGTRENEVCVSSLLFLVRNNREWIQKILFTLVELGGFLNIVTWDGFLWVFLQFCTLSKMELIQVLFFIIARDTRSWSLNMLTSAQLEDFYSDWVHCPVKSFDTEPVSFDQLPKTIYTMVGFADLVTCYTPLINPLLHLQRSIQQSVPSLRFWGDYDRIKVNNRHIPLDFFRFRKSQSITEMIYEANNQGMDAELQAAKDRMGSDNLRVLKEKEGLLENMDHSHFLPLPGSRKPPTKLLFQPKPEPIPVWMEEQNLENKDPVKGTLLGSAVPPTPRTEKPQPKVAKLVVSIDKCSGLPLPVHSYCTCEIEGRPGTRCRTQTFFGTDPIWNEVHEIYGYIVDDTKRLEFNIWEASLLVKTHVPQRQFYPHGWEGSLHYPGGKLDIKIEVMLPTTVIDATEMVLSTFGEEMRDAKKNADMKVLIEKLKHADEKKKGFGRFQQLDFIARSRVKEPARNNLVLIMQRSRPEELVDRPVAQQLGRH